MTRVKDLCDIMDDMMDNRDNYSDCDDICPICGVPYDPEPCQICGDGFVACACGTCDNHNCEMFYDVMEEL